MKNKTNYNKSKVENSKISTFILNKHYYHCPSGQISCGGKCIPDNQECNDMDGDMQGGNMPDGYIPPTDYNIIIKLIGPKNQLQNIEFKFGESFIVSENNSIYIDNYYVAKLRIEPGTYEINCSLISDINFEPKDDIWQIENNYGTVLVSGKFVNDHKFHYNNTNYVFSSSNNIYENIVSSISKDNFEMKKVISDKNNTYFLDKIISEESSGYENAIKLKQFYKVILKNPDTDKIKLDGILKEQNIKEYYMESMVSGEEDPAINPDNDEYYENQGYLNEAPQGIDAKYVWNYFPNTIENPTEETNVVDLEQGWLLGDEDQHEDHNILRPLIYGDNRDGQGTYRGNHGTAVVGEIAGLDNDKGVIGIAPGVGTVRVSSHYRESDNTDLHVAEAIIAAASVMNIGDVLLLEVQRSADGGLRRMPTESDLADLEAIKLATARGIIVVEAAGNGGNNLNNLSHNGAENQGKSTFNRNSPNFIDSGAIMVAACSSTVPHVRLDFSNNGNRIDCFAWGENVYTAGYANNPNPALAQPNGVGSIDDNNSYTFRFSGTSSASPIVVGAALLVQSYCKNNLSMTLSPQQMRYYLSRTGTGTRAYNNTGIDADGNPTAGINSNVGVMPDLRKIIPSLSNGVPDIYIRDTTLDDGNIPSPGIIGASPDIIVRQNQVLSPQITYGFNSGTASKIKLSNDVSKYVDNYIYTRVKNKGTKIANNTSTDLYWGKPSTLLTPDQWNYIGTSTSMNVPNDNNLYVHSHIKWTHSDVSSANVPDHCSFIAITGCDGDPKTLTQLQVSNYTAEYNWADFIMLIRNNNNITWKSFNVLGPKLYGPFKFDFGGAFDIERLFELEVYNPFDDNDIKFYWLLPRFIGIDIIEAIGDINDIVNVVIDKVDYYKIQLPDKKRYAINLRIPQSVTYNSFISIETTKQIYSQEFYAKQSFIDEQQSDKEDIEIGRVTWAYESEPDVQECDPDLICGEALTCVDGLLYPTTCGPSNCDKPIRDCDECPQCPDCNNLENNKITKLDIQLKKGWNMISGLTEDSIIESNNITIDNTLYTFDEQYILANELRSGKGYWIKASENGTINVTPKTDTSNKLYIYQRSDLNENIDFILPNDNSSFSESFSEDQLKENFKDKLQKLGYSVDKSAEVKVNDIDLEEVNDDNNNIHKITIAKKLSYQSSLDGIKVIGPGSKCSVTFNSNSEVIGMNINHSNNFTKKEQIDVMSKEEVIELAQIRYTKLRNINLEAELCYYSSKGSNEIIPSYIIKGRDDDTDLLEMVLPANKTYIPTIKINDGIPINANSITAEEITIDVNSKNIKNDEETVSKNNSPKTFYKIPFRNINVQSSEQIELVSSGLVHDFKILSNNKIDFDILIPKELKNENQKLPNQIKIVFGCQNIYDFTNYHILDIDISTLISNLNFNFIYFNDREINPDHGGNRHNYGIEWGEQILGGLTYTRYINEMEGNAHKEYSWDGLRSWERDFKDYSAGGFDDYFVDNVDMSAYIGHGNGGGFTFDTSVDDGDLTYIDAGYGYKSTGKGWGNRDLEFQAWLSCKVLKENWTDDDGNVLTWDQRWGPSFNGLHLICGYQTNASVGRESSMFKFAQNQYDNKQTIMNSWFNAVEYDQPSDRQAVVMGPLYHDDLHDEKEDKYRSIPSSISDLHRAHWNDYIHGVKEGPGKDIPKSDIKGFWRVIYTV